MIIPVRNGAAELGQQLEALASQEFDRTWEVVVVDNGSTDSSAQLALSYATRLPARVVVAERPGRSHALNRGVDEARGLNLVFLDADDAVAPGYLAAMARALDNHPIVAARHDNVTLNPMWAQKSRPSAQESGVGNPFGFLQSAAGCSLGVQKDVMGRVGPFDPTMRFCEDIDFCWRASRAGYDITFVPDALLRYRYRSTLRGMFRQANGYGTSGPLLYKRYREAGMSRRSARTTLRYWLAPGVRLIRARNKGDFAELVFLVGFRVGLLKGSIKARVVYL